MQRLINSVNVMSIAPIIAKMREIALKRAQQILDIFASEDLALDYVFSR